MQTMVEEGKEKIARREFIIVIKSNFARSTSTRKTLGRVIFVSCAQRRHDCCEHESRLFTSAGGFIAFEVTVKQRVTHTMAVSDADSTFIIIANECDNSIE